MFQHYFFSDEITHNAKSNPPDASQLSKLDLHNGKRVDIFFLQLVKSLSINDVQPHLKIFDTLIKYLKIMFVVLTYPKEN